jgi:outer membrane immunogenic protein
MKKLLLSTVGLLALGAFSPTFAADMAVKAAPPAPLPMVYNWTGFYIGANGGWGSAHECWDYAVLAGPVFTDGCRDRSGGLIGGQIGYRWQANQFVFGLEAQGDWADLSHTRVSLIDPTLSTRERPTALASSRPNSVGRGTRPSST